MSKGKRRERELAEIYERAGYDTYRPQESKYGETDIYGEFDLLAIGPEPDPVHLVQCKANRARGIKQWSKDALEYARDGVRVRMAVCYDREGWRVLDPTPGGYEEVYDERGQVEDMGDGLTTFLKTHA